MSPAALASIDERLRALEEREPVRILYACESGSRAWGFPSLDSDYDVRLIYARPLAAYLSVGKARDVIEEAIDGELDVGGWDIRKCLNLLRQGNPVAVEWVSSPIVYRERPEALEPLRRLVEPAFRPRAAAQHYLGLARRELPLLGEDGKVRLKGCCYTLRAALAGRFVVDRGSPPPMELSRLMEACPLPQAVREEVDRLVEAKARSREGDRSAPYPALGAFLSEELERLGESLPEERPKAPLELFDAAFRETLRRLGELPGE